MLTIICIMILAYWIVDKEIDSILEKVKSYDLRGKINKLYAKMQPSMLKSGRVATRPLLQFYYVMSNEKTSTFDRVLMYAAIIYIISPISLLPSAVYRLLGVLDEGAAKLKQLDLELYDEKTLVCIVCMEEGDRGDEDGFGVKPDMWVNALFDFEGENNPAVYA